MSVPKSSLRDLSADELEHRYLKLAAGVYADGVKGLGYDDLANRLVENPSWEDLDSAYTLSPIKLHYTPSRQKEDWDSLDREEQIQVTERLRKMQEFSGPLITAVESVELEGTTNALVALQNFLVKKGHSITFVDYGNKPWSTMKDNLDALQNLDVGYMKLGREGKTSKEVFFEAIHPLVERLETLYKDIPESELPVGETAIEIAETEQALTKYVSSVTEETPPLPSWEDCVEVLNSIEDNELTHDPEYQRLLTEVTARFKEDWYVTSKLDELIPPETQMEYGAPNLPGLRKVLDLFNTEFDNIPVNPRTPEQEIKRAAHKECVTRVASELDDIESRLLESSKAAVERGLEKSSGCELERDEKLHESLMNKDHHLKKEHRDEKVAVQKIIDQLPRHMQRTLEAFPRQNLAGLKSFIQVSNTAALERHQQLEPVMKAIEKQENKLRAKAEQGPELSKDNLRALVSELENQNDRPDQEIMVPKN